MILCLETATLNCSVALVDTQGIRAIREEWSEQYIHSERLHLFIEQVVQDAGIRKADLKAVAVSQGPGSFTGLRIGVAAAKGVAYSLGIPLIAVNTLEVIARAMEVPEGDYLIPVMDARRQEVYCQAFYSDYRPAGEPTAEILSPTSFHQYVGGGGTVHLLGDGATKCQELLSGGDFQFYPAVLASARQMKDIALSKFSSGAFEDVAYSEPFYLKEFYSTPAKRIEP